MRRFEGIHSRHSQGDAQKEGHGRGLRLCFWRRRSRSRHCLHIENTNTNEHTLALAIRIANQVRDARCAPDALPPKQRHKAQSRILGRGIRIRRRRGRVFTRDSVEEASAPRRHRLLCTRHAREQGGQRVLIGRRDCGGGHRDVRCGHRIASLDPNPKSNSTRRRVDVRSGVPHRGSVDAASAQDCPNARVSDAPLDPDAVALWLI